MRTNTSAADWHQKQTFALKTELNPAAWQTHSFPSQGKSKWITQEFYAYQAAKAVYNYLFPNFCLHVIRT